MEREEREREREREHEACTNEVLLCVLQLFESRFFASTGSRRRSRREGNICVVRTTHVVVPEKSYGCGSSTCVRTTDISDGIEWVLLQIVTFD